MIKFKSLINAIVMYQYIIVRDFNGGLDYYRGEVSDLPYKILKQFGDNYVSSMEIDDENVLKIQIIA